ncbi:MAG: ATP-dependent helicase, partial [Verrucomicrobiota bacterium]
MTIHYSLKPSGGYTPQINYEAELNPEQYKAVSSKPGPMLIIAGAGSGKTRTLTYRVAYLVEHGVAPEKILLLTFTNKAAKEMMRRVEDLVPHDFSRMWGGTFHHVGHRLLRRHGEDIGIKKNFTIFDQEDSKDLINACMSDEGLNKKEVRFPKADVVQTIFSLSVNTQCKTEEIIEAQYPYFIELSGEILSLSQKYVERKRASNAVDYDDLLTLSLELLREKEDLRDRYQNHFQHILVDEYQDTNVVQAEFVDLLADAHHRVMVVGDDAQSIYSWRGANFENIINFPDRHEGTEVIRIETNYRSSPEVLELANESIANNVKQFPKTLKPVKPKGAKPAKVSVHDARQQAQFVAQRILELHDGGMSLEDIAILYRSHFHSMELQMELTKRNIPFQITSGLRFFEQAHVKDVSAFLRFAVNGDDEVSFKRVALMIPGIGAASAHRLWHAIHSGEAWDQAKVPSKSKSIWEQWGETHKQLLELVGDASPDQLIQIVLDAFYEDFLKVKFPNYLSRLDDLRQLQAYSETFENTAEFLAQLSLMTNLEAQPALDQDGADDAIKLSSIHQAKGLEWKSVFVIMLCDGMFPSARSLENEEGEEEERRLLYVAVT